MMDQENLAGKHETSLDMTRTDEPSAVANRISHTGAVSASESERDSDAYLLTNPEYFLQYYGAKWNISPSDIVQLVDRSARNAVVSVKHHPDDSTSRLFYLAHHQTDGWHVTEVFSPSADR